MRSRRYGLRALVAMLALAVAAGAGTRAASPLRDPHSGAMRQAAVRAADAIAVIRRARQARGLPLDPYADPNRTGLVGVESSPITTTVGDLAAKRTTTNPNMAAALVRWLADAGVRPGAVVAVGASGSFPGLIIATLAAAHALGAEPVVISSVASSSWGANLPSFTWLDMEAALVAEGWGPRSVAASPGGDADVGAGLDADGRAMLQAAMTRNRVLPIRGEGLRERVAARMAAYDAAVAGRALAAFVNVGGAAANVGTCPEILRVAPGVHRRLPTCRGEPGVLWLMSLRGVPVVHLLHVDGIAAAFGLPRDPVPLPVPGLGAPFARMPRRAAVAMLALLLIGTAVIVRWNARTVRSVRPTHQVEA
ncbi:MAG: poly-gamma-glutamate system protein [Armatimonadota bacterium]|nr:poly-gamma-glutamate system protein [Armatimonadota bacterium]